MSRTQKAILSLLLFSACCLSVFVIGLGTQAWQAWTSQPLGPALSTGGTLTPYSLPPSWTVSPSAAQAGLDQTPLPTRDQNSIPVETPLPAFSPATTAPSYRAFCGAPPVMDLLVIGADQRSSSYTWGLGDVIRLVRIDSLTPRITILEFPRDLWVEIPDIADNINGQDHEKLNQAYLYGNRGFGYTDDPAQGPGLMARTLALNFGVTTEHYVAVNMRTFVKVVNAVDGIDVSLPNGMDGRTAEDQSKRLIFPPGLNHLNGDEALTLARIRNDGVFARADNQDLVLCALREKLTRPQVLTQIPQLIASFQHSIQTDLSPDQISQLACLGPQINPANIVFASFPQDLFKPTRIYDPVFKGRVFIWDVDFNILRDYVARFQAGTWPPAGLPSAPQEETPIFCQ